MLEKLKGSGCLVSLGWSPKMGKLTGAPQNRKEERLQGWGQRGGPGCCLDWVMLLLSTCSPFPWASHSPQCTTKLARWKCYAKKQSWGTHTTYILVPLKNQISKASKSQLWGGVHLSQAHPTPKFLMYLSSPSKQKNTSPRERAP